MANCRKINRSLGLLLIKTFAKSVTPGPIWRAGIKTWNFAHRTKRLVNEAFSFSYETISYSAYGEDLIVLSWLRRLGCDQRKLRYLDIGAAHPKHLSNTFLFYQTGACGVLVEPDSRFASQLRKERPKDVVIEAGAVPEDGGTGTLYRMTSGLFNSFDSKKADQVVSQSKNWHNSQLQHIQDRIEVPLLNINEIIRDHFWPEQSALISIDVEGVELQLLGAIDFSRIKADTVFVIIEAGEYISEISGILDRTGLQIVARTADNWVLGYHKAKPLF